MKENNEPLRVLYVATVVKTHIMQFHISILKMLKSRGCEVDVVARNDYDNLSDCIIPYCDNYINIPFCRNPLGKENISAYRQIKKIIDRGNYDIIHCHTPVAGVLTRLAARKARKKGANVLYTAHGFHFYRGAPLINWAVYYPVEKICSRITDTIITINHEDYELARKKFASAKIEYVPGVGIDTESYRLSESEKTEIRERIRSELSIPENAFVITCVGELIRRKNHQLLISLLNNLPQDIYLLIVGQGVFFSRLSKIVEEKGVSRRVRFTGYRRDISGIYAASDLCVLASFQEGLPVALMEGMASGLPCIASDIRGCRDLVDNEEVLCSPFEPEKWRELILDIYNNPEKAVNLGKSNRDAVKAYDIKIIEERMKQIYRL